MTEHADGTPYTENVEYNLLKQLTMFIVDTEQSIGAAMNLYIRTLGFDNMTSEAEAKFIKTGIRESIKEGFVIRHEKLDRGVIILRLSNSTGLYVYGRYEKNVFKYEYYFPFVVGKTLSDNEEMTIERHLDKESYAVICDELKTGVTLDVYKRQMYA